MKHIQAGDLRNRVDFYIAVTPERAQPNRNELGEDVEPVRNAVGEDIQELELYKANVPAQMLPMQGTTPEASYGHLDDTLITHKIRIRAGAVTMRPDLVIVYKNQRYYVRYWQPVYNNTRFMEIMAMMEVNV